MESLQKVAYRFTRRKKLEIEIKNANVQNLTAINALLHASKAYWGYDKNFMDLFMEKLGISRLYLLKNQIKLFYVNAELAGFYSFSINTDGILELDNFFLHPDYIGSGLGKELWTACCQTAKKYNKKEFIIWGSEGKF